MSGLGHGSQGRQAPWTRTIPPGRDTSRSSSVFRWRGFRNLVLRAGCSQIDAVQQATKQRGLNALDVHDQIGHGPADRTDA
jgi:hypothetical protein